MLLLLMIIALLRLHHLRQQSRKDKHEQVMRLLGLTTVTGQRFFDAIFESQNRSLFRDYFRMDQEAFGALFQACQSHIRSSLGSQREVLAVALNWLETAATCRSQEVLFDLAFSRCTSTVFMEFTQLYDPLGFPFFRLLCLPHRHGSWVAPTQQRCRFRFRGQCCRCWAWPLASFQADDRKPSSSWPP
ncbi:hypothetical protein F444_02145 [Phytophthora nicotianae P1976]|uniref:Uncharacterized protein n=1 Tax=Phytophthora nicotianae P1976 TaxID=1317066 RepID=A0A081AYE6_PHYNI|nr:hypothetical protein F444_02145 [Phytophthora nicotianae P1976]